VNASRSPPSASRPFEQRVLYEMRQAVLFNGFVTRTHAQENAEADRSHVWNLLRYDHQTVIKLRALNIEDLIDREFFRRFCLHLCFCV
jgi:hypothetical protein